MIAISGYLGYIQTEVLLSPKFGIKSELQLSPIDCWIKYTLFEEIFQMQSTGRKREGAKMSKAPFKCNHLVTVSPNFFLTVF
jgi:hypothetical protein